jgi:hypothetical protein
MVFEFWWKTGTKTTRRLNFTFALLYDDDDGAVFIRKELIQKTLIFFEDVKGQLMI